MLPRQMTLLQGPQNNTHANINNNIFRTVITRESIQKSSNQYYYNNNRSL